MNKVVVNKNIAIKKYPSKCYFCGKNIFVFRSSLENKRNFCSDECENAWRSNYWKELQKNKSFGFKKGHKMSIGNTYAVGYHPRSEWKIGHVPWNKDIPCLQETKNKISMKKLGIKLNDIHKLNISIGIKAHLPKTAFKKGIRSSLVTEFKKGFRNSRATEFKKGIIPWNKGLTKELDKRLDHPELKEERSRKLFKALKLSPNKSEKKLIHFLSRTLPKEYKFVGNGKIFIEGLVPDFININGQKKIIELYGEYWHKKPKKKIRDKKRIKTYKKYGYRTLIIWTRELKNLDILKEKIWKFNEKINFKNWIWIYDKKQDDFYASHNSSIRGKFFNHEFGVYAGGGGDGGSITSHTYFYYVVYFPSRGIIRTEPILLYDQYGTLLYTLGPNEPRVDYEGGLWQVPGNERNENIELISTASFWVHYSSDKLQIDYANVLFKIDKALIPNTSYAKVTADFEYATALVPIDSGRNIFDGRWDTQAQVVFYAKPPSGYAFAVFDLGQAYDIQAIDLIHGFFKPDERRSFDINNKYTLQYSTDNVNYYSVCKEATNFNLGGGASISFERDKLGDNFSARYFKLEILDMNKVEFGNGCWVASFVEFAAYRDVVLKGECFLTPTTALNGNYAGSSLSGAGATVDLTVDDTSAFDEYGTAYLDETAFTYSSTNATQFLYCSGAGVFSAQTDGTRISEEVESDTLLYDDDGILPKLGDKVFKNKDLNPYLDNLTKVRKRSKDYLTEFLKDHHKASISVGYGPHYRVAQTVLLVDETNNVSRRYFIESLKGNERALELVVAYYPS